MAGKIWVPFSAWWSADPLWRIILEPRLPRAVLGLVLGAVLGLSGAVLQGYLRNPLADPAVVGVSSSAALGAVEDDTPKIGRAHVRTQSLMRISYSVFRLKKNKHKKH